MEGLNIFFYKKARPFKVQNTETCSFDTCNTGCEQSKKRLLKLNFSTIIKEKGSAQRYNIVSFCKRNGQL